MPTALIGFSVDLTMSYWLVDHQRTMVFFNGSFIVFLTKHVLPLWILFSVLFFLLSLRSQPQTGSHRTTLPTDWSAGNLQVLHHQKHNVLIHPTGWFSIVLKFVKLQWSDFFFLIWFCIAWPCPLYNKKQPFLYLPQFIDHQQFYIALDNKMIVEMLRTEIAYLASRWRMTGRPTVTFPISQSMLSKSTDTIKSLTKHMSKTK